MASILVLKQSRELIVSVSDLHSVSAFSVTFFLSTDAVFGTAVILPPYNLCNNNNNNILYSSQRKIKAVVRSHNKEHISIILSHETHAHTHS